VIFVVSVRQENTGVDFKGGPHGGEEQIEYCEAFLRAHFLLNTIKYGILEGVELNTTCILQTL
jgi:hypothetical protein